MKKTAIIAIAAVMACACAKQETVGTSTAAKRYLDAFMQVNYPGIKADELGVYTLEETAGTGAPAEKATFVRLDYTISSIDGIIGTSTLPKVNKQTGAYKSYYYYGPKIWNRGEKLDRLSAGLEDALSGMKVGGYKKVLIPGWLSENGKRYSEPEKYVLHCSGTSAIYELSLKEAFDDVDAWQKDSIARYMAANFPGAEEDPDQEGFWYLRTKEPTDTASFTTTDSIYVDYTASRLDGTAFDSTIERTAKRYGFYTVSNSYKSMKINWKEDYTEISWDSSSSSSAKLINGFSYAVHKMHHGEAGTAVFWSALGYGASGSGAAVPAYCPLRFDIEVQEKN